MHRQFFILVLVAGLFVGGSADAQRQQRFGDMAARFAAETDTLMARLDLAEEQVEAVRAILDSRAEKLGKLRPLPGGGQAQFQAIRTKREEIEKESVAALTPLLSEVQLDAYTKYLADRQAMRRGRGGRRGGQ